MPNPHTGIWTPERIDRLRELQAKGTSAVVMAKLLGGGLSRSAVLGKLHRLGIVFERKPKTPKVATGAMQHARAMARPRGRSEIYGGDPHDSPLTKKLGAIVRNAEARKKVIDAARVKGEPAPPWSPASTVPDTIALAARPWETRGASECAWPIGDGPIMSCCNRTEAGETYCPDHRRVAYTPAKSYNAREIRPSWHRIDNQHERAA